MTDDGDKPMQNSFVYRKHTYLSNRDIPQDGVHTAPVRSESAVGLD